MILCFKPGNVKLLNKTVSSSDTAAFETGEVHPVYATFALGRDVEWACRQFVLEMKEEHEEGIGTELTIYHVSPALVGSNVTIEVKVKSITGNEIICSYEVRIGNRLIAHGQQGQKIISKHKLENLFNSLTNA